MQETQEITSMLCRTCVCTVSNGYCDSFAGCRQFVGVGRFSAVIIYSPKQCRNQTKKFRKMGKRRRRRAVWRAARHTTTSTGGTASFFPISIYKSFAHGVGHHGCCLVVALLYSKYSSSCSRAEYSPQPEKKRKRTPRRTTTTAATATTGSTVERSRSC